MSEEIMNQLKQFETILKNCILDRFKSNLSEDKKNILMSTSYLKAEELSVLKSGNEIQGKILRDMLSSIINIKSTKEFALGNGTNITLPVGEDIEKEIIEFYASNIADKYKFGINPGNPNLSLAFGLIECFGDKIDNMILNSNIIQMFTQPSAANFAKTYTDELLKPYSTVNLESPTGNVVELVDDPVKSEPVNEEVDILSLTNNQESNVTEALDIIETIDLTPVEEETQVSAAPVQVQPQPQTQQSVISEDKYKDLCMKFARNEELTPEEYNMLVMSTPDLLSEDDKNKLASANVDTPEQTESHEVVFRGFTISAFQTYFVVLSIILLVVLGFIIL